MFSNPLSYKYNNYAEKEQCLMNKNIFLSGIADFIILYFLNQRDCYIYELVQAAIQNSNGNVVLTQNAIYIAAYKLQEAGYISQYTVQIGKRMKRVYYHLEEPGKQYLRELTMSYERTMKGFEDLFHSSIGGDCPNEKR